MVDDRARRAFLPHQVDDDGVRFSMIVPDDIYASVRALADKKSRSKGYVTRGLMVLGLRAMSAGAELPSPADYGVRAR